MNRNPNDNDGNGGGGSGSGSSDGSGNYICKKDLFIPQIYIVEIMCVIRNKPIRHRSTYKFVVCAICVCVCIFLSIFWSISVHSPNQMKMHIQIHVNDMRRVRMREAKICKEKCLLIFKRQKHRCAHPSSSFFMHYTTSATFQIRNGFLLYIVAVLQ